MMKVALILALVGLALSQAPPTRPVVSETFEAKIVIEFINGTHHLYGQGDQLVNYTSNQAVFRADFDVRPTFMIYELARYDLGALYELDNRNWTACHFRNLTGHLPTTFAYIANATYGGLLPFRGESFNWWNATTTIQGMTFTFATAFLPTTGTPTIPALYDTKWEYQNNFEERLVGFQYFQPTISNPQFFDVPKICTA